jgi:hypothetical protein
VPGFRRWSLPSQKGCAAEQTRRASQSPARSTPRIRSGRVVVDLPVYGPAFVSSNPKKGVTNKKENPMSQSKKSKPAHEIRLGSIKATIWQNQSENGVRYNVSISRSYRDGDVWKDTQSFGRDDLPRVAKCADLAYEWIFTKSSTTAEEDAVAQA